MLKFFYQVSLKICLDNAYSRTCRHRFVCNDRDILTFHIYHFQFVSKFNVSLVIYSLLKVKSLIILKHGPLKFRCCILARQCTIIGLGNVLKICLVFLKSELNCASKGYAYR